MGRTAAATVAVAAVGCAAAPVAAVAAAGGAPPGGTAGLLPAAPPGPTGLLTTISGAGRRLATRRDRRVPSS